jgi:hypothetical protein
MDSATNAVTSLILIFYDSKLPQTFCKSVDLMEVE